MPPEPRPRRRPLRRQELTEAEWQRLARFLLQPVDDADPTHDHPPGHGAGDKPARRPA